MRLGQCISAAREYHCYLALGGPGILRDAYQESKRNVSHSRQYVESA